MMRTIFPFEEKESYRSFIENDRIWSLVYDSNVSMRELHDRDIIYDDFPIEICREIRTPHKNPPR